MREHNFDDVATDGELEHTLQELLVSAHYNGVDVEGAWTCRNGGDCPDWEANVIELENPGED